MNLRTWYTSGIKIHMSDEDDYECTDDNGVDIFLTHDQMKRVVRYYNALLIKQGVKI